MGDSFRYPQGCKLEQGNSRIFLPKVGWLRYRNSRPILGKVCNVTVSQSGGKWFASVQTRRQVDAVQPTGGIIGIDLGIARFATLSDGTYLQPLHSFKQHQQQLKRYQRRMARKVKFSQNWRKAKANVSLVELYRRAQVLRVISFDRKLLGIDTSVRKRAKGEVTGFLYGLKSIWDFLFGGVVELNESNRDAVREILRGQVRETVDLLESAVDGWGEQGKRVSHQASAEYAERRESLSAKKVDFAHYAEGLQRKLSI